MKLVTYFLKGQVLRNDENQKDAEILYTPQPVCLL